MKLRNYLLLNLAALLLVFSLILPLWENERDGAITDLFFKIRGPLTSPSEIVIVGIDDDSFDNLSMQWPWPRSLHAELLTSLSKARARVVVFDILFDTPGKEPKQDKLFAEAIAGHKNLVLASFQARTEKGDYVKASWIDPTTELMGSTDFVGAINLLPDAEGTVRSAQLEFAGNPTLGALAASCYDSSPFQSNGVDRNSPLLINYLGPPGTIQTVSYYQALEKETFLPPHAFMDKLVFVGSTAGLGNDPNRPDHFRTPYSRSGIHMPGVEIHATIAHNLLHGNFLRQAPTSATRMGSILLALLGGFVFFRFSLIKSIIIYAAMVGLTILGIFGLFAGADYYVPPAGILIVPGIVFLTNITAHHFIIFRRDKRNRVLLKQSEDRIREILAAQPATNLDDGVADISARTVRVFISYRRKAEDARFMKEILEFLAGLHKERIEFWTDQELRLGDRWDSEIRQKLTISDIALVLVSQAYLDSDYCIRTEINSFLERGVTIMPILLSPCEWQRHDWLRERQFFPGNGETLAENYRNNGDRQRVFLQIRSELRNHADVIQRSDQ